MGALLSWMPPGQVPHWEGAWQCLFIWASILTQAQQSSPK